MIRTERLLLRRAVPGDLDAFHEMMTDALVMRYWSRPPHTSVDETRRFLEHMMQYDAQDVDEYVLEYEGGCIGKAGSWRAPEIGYLLHPDHWGKGFATEALQAVIPRCFAKFAEAPALTAECDPRNRASVALLHRLGFRHQKTVGKDFLYGESEWCDTACFALPRLQPPAPDDMR